MRGQEFLIVLALVQLPGFALSAYGVERWGRKPTLVGFLLLSAAGCMFYSFGSSNAVVVGSTLLMSFALLGTWGALYAFTPEVYPTDLRASGMGLAGAVARFGGLLAPTIIAPVMATHFTLSLGLLAGILVIGAIAIVCVDVEPRNRALD
jgi:putative MFS transporter